MGGVSNWLPLSMWRRYWYAVHKLILVAEIVISTISLFPQQSRLCIVRMVAVKILYMVVFPTSSSFMTIPTPFKRRVFVQDQVDVIFL